VRNAKAERTMNKATAPEPTVTGTTGGHRAQRTADEAAGELLRRAKSGQPLTLAEYARVEESLGGQAPLREKEGAAWRSLRYRIADARIAARKALADASGGEREILVQPWPG
jgi:hypothetical protein